MFVAICLPSAGSDSKAGWNKCRILSCSSPSECRALALKGTVAKSLKGLGAVSKGLKLAGTAS